MTIAQKLQFNPRWSRYVILMAHRWGMAPYEAQCRLIAEGRTNVRPQ